MVMGYTGKGVLEGLADYAKMDESQKKAYGESIRKAHNDLQNKTGVWAPQVDPKRAAIRAARDRLLAAPGPTRLQAEKFTAEALPTGPLKQFDIMRQRTQQRQAQAWGNQEDAMRRRLAAAGTLDSGAGVKALQAAQQQHAAQTEDAIQGIEAEEAGARAQMDEAVRQRNFQAQQAMEQRNLARAQFNEDAAFREKSFQADAFAKFEQLERQLDELDLQQLDYELRKAESDYNKALSTFEANTSWWDELTSPFTGSRTFDPDAPGGEGKRTGPQIALR